jgi:adenylylsulfate kinase
MKDNFTKIPTTYWITGLSGAGKTTLLPYLTKSVQLNSNLPCVFFDGDQLRNILNIKSFSIQARIENGLRYGRLCKYLNEQGLNVVIACIGLFDEIHDWNIKNIKSLKYILLDVPIEELIQRDPKGIYKDSSGNLKSNIVGLDIPACFPVEADVHFKWDNKSCKEKMIKYCLEKLF